MKDSVRFINSVCVVVSGVVSSAVPDNILTTPTTSPVADNTPYVGCYDPGYSLRHNYHYRMSAITLESCVRRCQGLEYARFAGVEASESFCYCGGDIADESVQRDDSLCDVPCPDDSLRTCGGDWLMSLYEIRGPSSVDDVRDAYFLLGISTGARLYNSGNLDTYATLLTTADWVYSVDYHFSRNLLFAHTKNSLIKATLDPARSTTSKLGPGNSSSAVIKSVTACEGFAVDWVHNRIFWANCDEDESSIMSCGLDGEADQVVLKHVDLNQKSLKRMDIDPYQGMLFWSASGVLQSVETSGESFNPNMTAAELTVRALALDLRQQRVYYVAFWNTTVKLYSMDYDGDRVVVHYNGFQIRSVYGMSVLGNKLFWVNYANTRDVLYEAPINVTDPEQVKILKTIDKAVWHMRVAHPTLQSRPQVDPCHEKGCSYQCTARGLTVATCKCPHGQILDYDDVSCTEELLDNSYPSPRAGRVILSLLFIFLVVLTSMALAFLGNKYWSLVQSKIVGASYFRRAGGHEREEGFSAGVTETQAAEDCVNLINDSETSLHHL